MAALIGVLSNRSLTDSHRSLHHIDGVFLRKLIMTSITEIIIPCFHNPVNHFLIEKKPKVLLLLRKQLETNLFSIKLENLICCS